MYAKHRSDKPFREAWVYGKLAYNEYAHGSKTQAAAYANIALSDLKSMPEPVDLDECYFYIEGTTALSKALAGLGRSADYNRTQTLLGHARIRFGRTSTELLMIRALIYFSNNDYDSARNLCAQAMKEEPGFSGSYYLRAVLNFKELKFSAAEKDLNRAIELCPDFSHAYMLKGLCFLFEDKKEQALADLNKAVDLSHSSAAYQTRAAFKFAEEDMEGGEKDIAEAMKASDATWMSYSMHGDYMLQYKNYDQAITDYSKSIDLMDQRVVKYKARAYYRRGLCYRATEKPDKALSDFNQASAIDPARAVQVRKLLAKVDDTTPTKDPMAGMQPSSMPVPSHDGDEGYREYASNFEPAMPTFREGRDYIAGVRYQKPSKEKVVKKEDDKHGWISDAGPVSDAKNNSPVKKKDDTAAGANETPKKEPEKPAADPAATKSVAAAVTTDPYLKYLEQQLSAASESAAAADLAIKFKIQSDGSPMLEDTDSVALANK
jgi:tetratricopeptide (TPR) repeat protein